MISKIDFKKELKAFYRCSAKKMAEVTLPEMNFLMVDGIGEPGSIAHKDAIEALFSVSYTLKFTIKQELAIDYGVLPLEGLWWADDPSDFVNNKRENWRWTMMIMQPEWVDQQRIDLAIDKIKLKKTLAAIDNLRFEVLAEGLCAQTLHLGPFADEGPTVARLHDFIEGNGCILSGKHHEIYLSDYRRCAPENLKTIIRQPIKRLEVA